MKLTTIKDRTTGKDVILVQSSVHPNEHVPAFNKLAASPGNDTVLEVTRWVPERTVRFVTTAELKARQKAQADWEAAEQKRKDEKLARARGAKPPVSDQVKKDTMKPPVTKPKFTAAVAVLAFFFALLFATPANAQRYDKPVTLWSWKALVGPTNLVGTDPAVYGTLYNSGVIDGSKQDKVAVAVSFNYNTNTVQTNGIAWVRSLDQVNWDTNNIVLTYFHQTAAPAAAGARTVWTTNLTMNGFGYYKMLFWTNSGYGAAATVWPTNIDVKWVLKSAAP